MNEIRFPTPYLLVFREPWGYTHLSIARWFTPGYHLPPRLSDCRSIHILSRTLSKSLAYKFEDALARIIHDFCRPDQKEYYQLSSFFANIDERGLISYFTDAVPTPAAPWPSKDQQVELARAGKAVAAAQRKYVRSEADANERFMTWLADNAKRDDAGKDVANYLRARRLAGRGVRFIQLYHPGWDHHSHLPSQMRHKCRQTDQATAALIQDLKSHGMLEDTLVIWGGEFGRTSYCQGKIEGDDFGRDHHPRCFTMWMAGGGVSAGHTHGETDEYSYNVVENGVHIHDLHATILDLLRMDHERLTFKYQGRHFRLTDVHGHVVKEIVG